MIDASRPYAEILYPFVNPFHDLLTESFLSYRAMKKHLPKINGEIYKPSKVNTFKGFLMQGSQDTVGGFKLIRKNGVSLVYVHEISGMSINIRRPQIGKGSKKNAPTLIPMPEDQSLFKKPTARELLANRRPGPNDRSALIWDWPKKSEDGGFQWDLKFLLAEPGRTLDDESWSLGLELPRGVQLDEELTGFKPEESPLQFLADPAEENIEKEE